MSSRSDGDLDDQTTVPPPPKVAAAPPPPRPTLSKDSVLAGRYRLLGEAGRGGMGTVVEAMDSLLDRRVAIKLLKPLAGAEARATTVREARAMAGLRHRSICRVLEVILDPPGGGDPFIVLEWVDGTVLSQAWKDLSLDRRLAMFMQVCEAVASMHAAGLVHRDLKPSNILCDAEGVPVVIDFGLAARSGDDQTIGGTPGWSAPEQFASGTEVGPAADVFALGVLFFSMLTNSLPFEGPSTEDVLKRSREGDVPLPESLVPGISPALQRIALAAIDPDPSRRYADAGAMLADVRRFLAGETVLARPRKLFTRFADEVERHLAETERWRMQGLATEQEITGIRDGLLALQRPESPWILDSRRLSRSQVALYLGGWLLLLAITVGTWFTAEHWKARNELLEWTVPSALAAAVTLLGLVLARLGEQRAALVFLFTSAIAVPAALWQSLRLTGVLAAPEDGRDLLSERMLGLSNDQQLAVAGVGLLLALLYRLRTPSTAFTLAAAWFGLWTSLAVGLRWFALEGPPREILGEFARWLLFPSAALVAAGAVFDARTRPPAGEFTTSTTPRDGGPTLVSGLIMLVATLTALGAFVPEWFWLSPLATDEGGMTTERPTITVRASAFLGIGLLLLGLSFALGFRPTPLRSWCSRTLRWIVPSYLLIPIICLELEDAAPGWSFWLTALGVASIGLVAASSLLQWRPFLVSGLLGLSDLLVRGFIRIDEHVEDPSMPQILLMTATGLLGLLVMILAAYPERVIAAARAIVRRRRPSTG